MNIRILILLIPFLFSIEIFSQSAGCLAPTSSVYLEINYVRAMIHNGGDMWWDLTGNPSYEVPKGSGKQSLFAGAIWIGGTDINGQLHLMGQKYRQGGNEAWPGPLMNDGNTSTNVCTYYDKHYKANRNEVNEFREYINAKKQNNTTLLEGCFKNYTIPQNITDWPGNNTTPDYDSYLAPFFDANNDGIYNYNEGDYPYFDFNNEFNCGATRSQFKPMLYGDETWWWVFNDNGNIHTEFNGAPLKMEIRAQAYGYSAGNELDFTTFYNYYLINRSTYTVFDMYVGLWSDADLGDPWDDYIGCDVQRGLGYIYNGDDLDGSGYGITYGQTPPAIGVDFIRGMFCDNNNNDYGFSGIPNGCDESINGQFFNDGIVDNERMGMRHFCYFNSGGCAVCDPSTAVEAYYFLRSYWKDGSHLTYGGNGSYGSIEADFMHPGNSDPCGFGTNGVTQPAWSEETANNPPNDRRFVISSGPFTLEPGGFNDFTLSVPWARATSGNNYSSVAELKRVDDIVQKMFDNCFVPVTPIEAPDLTIMSQTNELIFYISVPQGSNNYTNTPEDYSETDPFIVCPVDVPYCDTLYRFEGYMVFQLKDASCTANDIFDTEKSALVFQCDIKNDYYTLYNYEYNPQTAFLEKKLIVPSAENNGIRHSFNIKKDFFATGENKLVNFKTYYYVAVAYAVNKYKEYDIFIPQSHDGQKRPCMVSPNSAFSKPLAIYQGIPHSPTPTDGGTVQNAEYGNRPAIKQVDGLGNGFNHLEITAKTHNKIMSGYPWKADTIEYKPGYGPVNIKVIDPLNLPAEEIRLRLIPDSTIIDYQSYNIIESKWVCEKYPYTDCSDFVYAKKSISVGFEQIIPQWGISIEWKQTGWPGIVDEWPENNGLVTSNIVWNDPSLAWLDMQTTKDIDGPYPMNWIRAGKVYDSDNYGYNDWNVPANYNQAIDPDQYYENVIDGLWAPYRLGSRDLVSTTSPNAPYGVAYHFRHALMNWRYQRLTSIDFYFTKDKTKWTRSPVIEMCEHDMTNNTFGPCFSEGNQWKFALRRHASVDKNGNYAPDGATPSTDENDPSFIGPTGMGWFPGYCIDIETGERLNIAFGEDSRYPHHNGSDMLWNPTNTFASNLYYNSGGVDGDLYVGGKHYIYVFGHNDLSPTVDPQGLNFAPAYDYGKHLYDNLSVITVPQNVAKGRLWGNAMWVTLPMLSPEITVQQNPSDPYYFIRTDCKVSIRVANPYRLANRDFAYNGSPNDSLPMYYFDLRAFTAQNNDLNTAKDALNMINVVPNPYYCGSFYENSANDFIVKITNLPEQCEIFIFAVNGTQIKRISKNDNCTWYNWDIRDEKGKPVGSGVYIIHIKVPGVGERTIKWAGVIRDIY